jgi:hypothetical protein
MDSCPVCGARLDLGTELEIEKERYVGSVDIGGELTMFLPFCNRDKNCNRVLAANRMDELAAPFLEAVGNA